MSEISQENNVDLSSDQRKWIDNLLSVVAPFKGKNIDWFNDKFSCVNTPGARNKLSTVLFFLCNDPRAFSSSGGSKSMKKMLLSAINDSNMSLDELMVEIKQVVSSSLSVTGSEAPDTAVKDGSARLDSIAFADERDDVGDEPDNAHEQELLQQLKSFVLLNQDLSNECIDELRAYVKNGWYEPVFKKPIVGTKLYRGMSVSKEWLADVLGSNPQERGVSVKKRTYEPLRNVTSWTTSVSTACDFAIDDKDYCVILSTTISDKDVDSMISLRGLYSVNVFDRVEEGEVLSFKELQYSVLTWAKAQTGSYESLVAYLTSNSMNPKQMTTETHKKHLSEKTITKKKPEAPSDPRAKFNKYAFADQRSDVPKEKNTNHESLVYKQLQDFFSHNTDIPKQTVREIGLYLSNGWYSKIFQRVDLGTTVFRGMELTKAHLANIIGHDPGLYGNEACGNILKNQRSVSSWTTSLKAAVNFCYAYNDGDEETYSVLFTAPGSETMISCQGMNSVADLVESPEESVVLAINDVRLSNVKWCAGRFTMVSTRSYMMFDKKPTKLRPNSSDFFDEMKKLARIEKLNKEDAMHKKNSLLETVNVLTLLKQLVEVKYSEFSGNSEAKDERSTHAIEKGGKLKGDEKKYFIKFGDAEGADFSEDAIARGDVQLQVLIEYLAYKIYGLYKNINIPESIHLVFDGDRVGIATSDVGAKKANWNAQGAKKLNSILANISSGVLVDMFLANWDANKHGNLLLIDGNAYRIDPGGSMTFRARGNRKGGSFTNSAGETSTMIDPEMQWNARPEYLASDLIIGAKEFLSVSWEQISSVIKETYSEVNNELDENDLGRLQGEWNAQVVEVLGTLKKRYKKVEEFAKGCLIQARK